jgi:transcriptional regulator with XRE-family HTH domain
MKLREWLYRARLTIKDFSEQVEITRNYLHMLMNGSRVPSSDLVDKIALITKGKVKKIQDIQDKKEE